MKKAVCLLSALILALLLCGCTQDEPSSNASTASFSYTDDYALYKDQPGVKKSDFVNTQKTKSVDTNKAIELAKKECKIGYNKVDVAFDADLKIYRVSFYKEDTDGGNLDVYINADGITQLIVQGE